MEHKTLARWKWCLSAWFAACTQTQPTDPPSDDTAAPADPQDTDAPPDDAPLPPAPAEVVQGLGPAMRATLAAASQVRHSALAELLDHMLGARRSGCGEVSANDDGTSTWVGTCGGDASINVDLSWDDHDLRALTRETVPWVETWLPVACPSLAADVAPIGAIPSIRFAGYLTQVADGAPQLHVRGSFSDVMPSWPGCTAGRTWADGYADDPEAAPDAWTATPLEVQRLEVGRARSPDAALLTIDGTIGGMAGAFPTVDVVGGAWRVGPESGAASGVWSLRDPGGVWFEATFGEGACAVLRAPGYADTPACLSDDDVAALTTLTQAAVP